jgi:hypothetical protein
MEEPAEPLEVLLSLKEEAERELEQVNRELQELLVKSATMKGRLISERDRLQSVYNTLLTRFNQTPLTLPGRNLEEHEASLSESLERELENLKSHTKMLDIVQSLKTQYDQSASNLAMVLKDLSGVFTPEDLQLVQQDPSSCVQNWKREHDSLSNTCGQMLHRANGALSALKTSVEQKNWELRYKTALLADLDKLQVSEYAHVQTIVQNMKRFAKTNLDLLESDKLKAQEAQQFWANRAALRVLRLLRVIDDMVGEMTFQNESGKFPLVYLQDGPLPKQSEEIEERLASYFITAMERVLRDFDDFQSENAALSRLISSLISDAELVYVALGRKYPTLMIYNMQTTNAFANGRPKAEHFSTWKKINEGTYARPDGSGGQKVSARMVVMMMLLSSRSGSSSVWQTLFCDNPFGQAVSRHLLDPVFEVAKKLKFQLVVLTPPELVKTDVSIRFPSFYKIELRQTRGKELVTEKLQTSFRNYA